MKKRFAHRAIVAHNLRTMRVKKKLRTNLSLSETTVRTAKGIAKKENRSVSNLVETLVARAATETTK